MSNGKVTVSMKDIPSVEEIKSVILEVVSTGRTRGINALEKDVYEHLGLSKEQRKYKIKGSSTTLLSNRYKDAISDLKKEGALYSPSNGKIKLTDYAKQVLDKQGPRISQQSTQTDTDSLNLEKEDIDNKKSNDTLRELDKNFTNKFQETAVLQANEIDKAITSKIQNINTQGSRILNEWQNKKREEETRTKTNEKSNNGECNFEVNNSSDGTNGNGVFDNLKQKSKINSKVKYVLPYILVVLGGASL